MDRELEGRLPLVQPRGADLRRVLQHRGRYREETVWAIRITRSLRVTCDLEDSRTRPQTLCEQRGLWKFVRSDSSR